jgi:CheY-like chemotaxis protein
MILDGKRILFIDDDLKKELSSAKDYLEVLTASGLLVDVYISVRAARDHIQGRGAAGETPDDFVILDMMMPLDIEEDRVDADPMTIGAYILRKYLRHAESAYVDTPVLILTNRDPSDVQPLVAGISKVWVKHKWGVPAFHLPRLVSEILSEADAMP